jgi:RHS repeat-associated protein
VSSIGISGNFSKNTDYTDQTWMDMNGDGLPDKVYKDGTVRINLGYSFAPAQQWNFNGICEGGSMDYGGGIGVNICNKSIMGGVGISKTDNEATKTFMDVNGDGLPDLVIGNTVMFNTGAGFASPILWNGLGSLDAGESIGESANFGFTIGITFVIIPIKICINPSGSVSKGINYNKTMLSDIDGDGLPDFLSSDQEGELFVKHSLIGRTNKLKTVNRPLGSNFTIDYKRTPACYNDPGGRWTLASVKDFDGLKGDGVDSTLVTFEYNDGQYNRHEHEFYGFASVKTHFHDTGNRNIIYRTFENQYSNQGYYTKGVLLSETLTDGNGSKQTGSLNTYELRDIHTGALLSESFAQNDNAPVFVSLEQTQGFVYEGDSTSQITTRVTYAYDTLGNITGYTDYSTGNEKDKVSVSIQYHSDNQKYLHAIPSLQEVYTSEGLKRKHETLINNFGDIIRITQLMNADQIAQYDMEYDDYGNMTKITRPANYQGERLWYAYEFDSVVHSFVKKVSDAYGYVSSTVYDYKWGMPIESIDMNNEKMRYTYDIRGRMLTVIGPHEIASGKPYTIAFDYFPDSTVPYAHTRNYDSIYNADIETYTFADGFGRPVQVKKTAMLFDGPDKEDMPGLVVSGKSMYDAFGRVIKSYQPVFEPLANATIYNATPDSIKPTITGYDVLDRIVNLTLPDGAVTTQSYAVGVYNGEVLYIDTLTDALGRKAISYTNAKGQKCASTLNNSSGTITTRFTYNAINELLTVTDPKGNQTLSVYDIAGRRISVKQPDAGLTEFTYDAAGNLTSKITANLRKQVPNGGAITYKYDRERLTEIVFPKNIQNRVQYSYGKSGASFYRAGRVTLIQDASGGEEFFYGSMGVLAKTIRTVQLGDADMRTWIWSATYDTWDRVQTMTYPDGEKVSYQYNKAGNLQSMAGTKLNRTYNYINRIGYNKYEKQVYLQYGNGAITTYNYEPERQHLTQMNVTSNSKQLMDNTYKYDVLNNVLGITNGAGATGDVGGSTSHAYTYDDLNRLISAAGVYKGTKDTGNYTLSMQYDIMGNILQKNQANTKNGQKQTATTYNLSYKYEGSKPNAATEIGDRKFTYDENGNLTNWEDTATNDFRQLAWDEENRLKLISDNGYISNYVYDANGERVVKSSGGSQGVYINGAPAGIVNHSDNNYTVYVSPYFVVQNERFTKYYYAGSNRVTGKIGNGQFENQYLPGVFEITAGGINYVNRQQQISNSRTNYEQQLETPPGPPTMKGIYAEPENTGTALPNAGSPDTIAPPGWPQKPVYAPAGGPPGAPVQWGNKITNDNVEAGFGFVGNGNVEENLRYFYHSDHLGSTSYITNAKGDITQFIAYMPFGEEFVEQHTDWDSPYKFNAKELDAETGLYYYGARYYDPKTSVWLGADALAEKHPFQTPFVYCSNNPVVYLDPDGNEIYYSQNGDRIGKYGKNNHVRVINDDQLNTAQAEFKSYNKARRKDHKATNEYLEKTLPSEGSVAYENYFSTVQDVTYGDALETYGENNLNCNTAAQKQLEDNGQHQTGAANAIEVKVNNILQSSANAEQNSSPPTALGNSPKRLGVNAIGASIYIMTQLNEGHLVMVGLEEQDRQGGTFLGQTYNYNALTGHFVAINSATVNADNGHVTFGYMDNAAASCGLRSTNQLSLGLSNGSMKDTYSPCVKGVSSYHVTEVRKNK